MDVVFIIAEAGVNHNGNFTLACELALAACEAGADAVKFQTFKTEKVVTKKAMLAEYQMESCKPGDTQFDMIKKLELSYDEFSKLKKYCDSIGIMFLTTPDEFESADFVENIVDIYKIGSGEVTNLPFLEHIAAKGKPVILSTGMSDIEEVKKAACAITKNQKNVNSKYPPLTLLHCVSCYPAEFSDVNLKAMLAMKKELGFPVGYSDHTMGIETALGAVAMGAAIIEKHFTLDKKMEGPDHKASLEPCELKKMVSSIRNLEKAMGNGIKKPAKSELPTR